MVTDQTKREVEEYCTMFLHTVFEWVGIRGTHVYLRRGRNAMVQMTIAERGGVLMRLERSLQMQFGIKLEVFLEPVGDMNKLRTKLRGVTVNE